MSERLESWKEIAAYLDREVRTVQRWATARRLPVHRLPGGHRPRVFSLKRELDAWLRAEPREPHPAPATSVAVLPFLNLAGAPEDQYFGDGLADDLINDLVRVAGLRVIARTSSFAFSSRGQDVREIGARLGAAWLIEGSIRRAQGRVRVSAQLVNSADGCHAWSEVFDRQLTGVFEVQAELAHAIALALKQTLTPRRAVTRPTEDLEAYDLWVKGRSVSQHFTPEAYAEARACYEAAIQRDPNFARPHFGLAELLFHGVQFGLDTTPGLLPRAYALIERSLELDAESGEAQALRAVFLGMLDYDWAAAETAFERAFELAPGSATVRYQHAWYHLVPRMRVAEAIDEAQQAVVLDPLSPFARGLLGLVWMTARQNAAAVQECRRAVELAPTLWILHWFYGTALLAHGRLVQGFRHARMVYEHLHEPVVVGAMAGIYGVFLNRGKAKTLLAELEAMSATMHVTPIAYALAYLGLGDDRVFEWLDKAIDARDPVATHLPSMSVWDGIRDDPRFARLLARMNLG
jgi:TolB-like protein